MAWQLYIIPLHTAEAKEFLSTHSNENADKTENEMREKFGLEMGSENEFVVGRENRALNITEKKVSRRQAVIRYTDGTLCIFFVVSFSKHFFILFHFR